MTLEAIRRAFAEEVRAVAHVEYEPLIEAFARVPRERFLGPGPWKISRILENTDPYRTTTDDDPRHIYHDVVVALDASRMLNNGQPSSLARWIESIAPRPGDRVLHVGCGVGYYTAIMAELVGPTGRVVGYDVDAALAARAAELLADWPQVTVEARDGCAPDETFDAIFVNCGATHVVPGWKDALGPGGRMLVPLTVHLAQVPLGIGIALRVERREGRWPARVVSQIGIFDCENARDPANEAELMTLAHSGAAGTIGAVAVDPHDRGEACLAHLPGFCLQRA